MNKYLLTAALAVTLLPSVHAQTAAAAPASSSPLANLTVSGAFDYESEYVYRGKKVTASAFQPTVNFANPLLDGTANVYIWTSQPLGNHSFDPGNEIDIGGYWQHSVPGIDNLTGEIGYQMYWYPEAPATNSVVSRSHEFHLGAIYDTTSILKYNISPTFKWYHDVILDSNTLTWAVNYSWDLSDSTGVKGLSLNPTFTLGWTGINRVNGDTGGQQWNDSYWFWELDLELDYKLNTSTTFYLAGH